MAISTVDFLLLNNQHYTIKQGEFRRFPLPLEIPQLDAQRVQSPFVDGVVTGFQSGLGLKSVGAAGTGYYDAEGMAPVDQAPLPLSLTTPLALKIGRGMTARSSVTGSMGLQLLTTFRNYLVGFPRGDQAIWDWDGTTFAKRTDAGWTTGFATLGYAQWGRSGTGVIGYLYFGTSDGQILRYTGGAISWRALLVGSATDAVLLGTTEHVVTTSQRLLAAYSVLSTINVVKLGLLDPANPATPTEIAALPHDIVSCGRTFFDTAYFFAYERESRATRGTLYSFPINSTAAADVTPLAHVKDDIIYSMEWFKGALYCGMGWGGRVCKLATNALEEVLHVGTVEPPAALPASDAIYGLTVWADSLYAWVYNSAGTTGRRWELYRTDDGVAWHLMSVGGVDTTATAGGLAVFQQKLVLADREATDGSVHDVDPSTSRLTSASLIGPNRTFGVSGIPFRWREMTLQHSALLSGQAVDGRYILDDGTETSVAINRDIGATSTRIVLPDTLRGFKFRPAWYFTNGASQDLTVYGESVRALPAPETREVWEGTLELAPRGSGQWSDAIADTDDALVKLERLQALAKTGQTFQAVDMFRDGTTVKRAMQAVFDPQVPLQPTVYDSQAGPQIDVPIRLVQAGSPQNFLKNASFEQDAVGAAPTDWATVVGTGTSALVSSAVTAQDGDKILAMIFDGVSASYGRRASTFNLTSGRYYTLSGYIRRTTTGGTVRIVLYDGSGTSIGPTTSLGAATDSAFIRYSVTFQVAAANNPTGCFVEVQGISTPVGTCYFDAIMLEEGAPASDFLERGSGGV